MIVSASDYTFESLYWYRVKQIKNELKALGKTEDNLTVEDLIPFDQFHPFSTIALDEAVKQLGISSSNHILDIGAGVGGSARYLAHRYGCFVTGIELHPQMCSAAIEWTQKTGLSKQVKMIEGDIINIKLNQTFDHWLSIGVFLHISDRFTLFSKCLNLLKPGGKGYIEDFFQRQPLTVEDKTQLSETIACDYLPTREQYLTDLETAGFINIKFEDVTDLWQPWEIQRIIDFKHNKSRHLRLHGEEIVSSLSRRYQVWADLFQRGNIGGARICAQRP
ncbi:MAG: methyltransferase domain-containing protein [Microcoleaceae cyanobacterium]